MIRRPLAAVLFAIATALTATSATAVQRTFVASFGSDANVATQCAFATPCRSFAAAVPVTDPRGEVLALDSIGYGAVTITKSITITAAPGVYAGISVASGNGVTIATPGVEVTLRGLAINSLGGAFGISMSAGEKLSVENCVISNFMAIDGAGILVTTPAKVRIVDSLIRDSLDGVKLQGGAMADIARSKVTGSVQFAIIVDGAVPSTTTSVVVADTEVLGNLFGIVSRSQDNATGNVRASVIRTTVSNGASSGVVSTATLGASSVVTVSDSLVTMHLFGFIQAGATATFESMGNNTVRQNGTNTSGTITPIAPI